MVVVKGVIIYNGKVLLMKRSLSSKVGGGEWELAGGKLHIGEELEETLTREVKEETGLEIKIKDLLYATTINDDPTRQLVFLHYLCEAKGDTVLLSEEHTDYFWANTDELKNMLRPAIHHDFERYRLFERKELL